MSPTLGGATSNRVLRQLLESTPARRGHDNLSQSGVLDSEGGLLLRRDVHRLSDLGFLTVDPESLRIYAMRELNQYPVYRDLDGQELQVEVTDGQRQWLAQHWATRTPS